ncbi:MAG: hypothetical protein LUB59_01075 [Candidatus Gastranaerophilales bacterium]|nr:hypothetical protein [Candidatus Gastranaerophilales bacterium]
MDYMDAELKEALERIDFEKRLSENSMFVVMTREEFERYREEHGQRCFENTVSERYFSKGEIAMYNGRNYISLVDDNGVYPNLGSTLGRWKMVCIKR